MIEYIKGQIVSLSPTELILDNHGIGYSILISLQTYEVFQGKTEATAYIHHYIREDEELYFGFATKDERELFRLLIGVSGIKTVKGIGLKSAQRVVLELKDKIVKGEGTDNSILFKANNSALADEATTALVMLGFSKANIGKVLPGIMKDQPDAKVEDIIKAALKRL